MKPTTTIPLATGMTLGVMYLAPRKPPARDAARVMIAGALLTAGLLTVDRVSPKTASAFGALVLTTAFLVHGVRVAGLLTQGLGIEDDTAREDPDRDRSNKPPGKAPPPGILGGE